MKFYHVRPKNSLKEQRGAVKDLIVAFFFVIFLSESCLACNFNGFEPHTTTYAEKIKKLSDNLPTDYNLTVFFQDTASLDDCCIELQAMLVLNRSIGHLYHHSMDKLQNLTSAVLMELIFLKDCPVQESSNCEVVRMRSSDLLQDLMRCFRSFDTKHDQMKCDFSQCTLYTCLTGRIETTLPTVTNATVPSIQPGIFTNGTNNLTTNAIPTVIGNATNPTPTSTHGNLTGLTNGTNQSPSLTTGSLSGLTNRTNTSPTLANGSLADVNLTSLTNPSSSLINGSLGGLTNRNSTIPALTNGSLATVANRTDVNLTSLIHGNDCIMAATLKCDTESSRIVTPLSLQTVAIILVISILLNMFLLGCLLKRNRQLNM
ncbi:uncharacterized protein LOC121271824 isoform X2 [Carcharodon carcharias]|uniref:uncharacterized protein LOC121271824 isoform X2 n=1 Tax=Carcharodon carcharias TaxID=13397 RepID=UPI001B7F6739|nr:uncharacterized protein LOC121271824 isoform X2 [Carcharodon carcharias]